MSDDLNYCLNGGLVVGTAHTIPKDFHVYRQTRAELVGCNRLWCGDCRVLVKSIAGFLLSGAGQDRPVDHAKLYESENPDDWELYLAENAQFRTYFCKCAFVSIPSLNDARNLDTKNIDNWRCAGHPKLAGGTA